MDQVTQNNAGHAQQSAHAAQQLNRQATALKTIIHQLLQVIDGGRTAPGPTPGRPPFASPAHGVSSGRCPCPVGRPQARAGGTGARPGLTMSPDGADNGNEPLGGSGKTSRTLTRAGRGFRPRERIGRRLRAGPPCSGSARPAFQGPWRRSDRPAAGQGMLMALVRMAGSTAHMLIGAKVWPKR